MNTVSISNSRITWMELLLLTALLAFMLLSNFYLPVILLELLLMAMILFIFYYRLAFPNIITVNNGQVHIFGFWKKINIHQDQLLSLRLKDGLFSRFFIGNYSVLEISSKHQKTIILTPYIKVAEFEDLKRNLSLAVV